MKNKLIAALLLVGLGTGAFFADRNYLRYRSTGELETAYEFTDETGQDPAFSYALSFPQKAALIDLNGAVRRALGQREMNGVVKLDNGRLAVPLSPLDETVIEEYAAQLAAFNESCAALGTQVLYVQPAYEISKFDPQLPAGVQDASNEIMDSLLARLSESGVHTLDLRQCMWEDGLDQYELYFRTDHHWTPEGAFYAYQKITEEIFRLTGEAPSAALTDRSNYQVRTYPAWHLGTRGQRTGQCFAGIDDFGLFLPTFDTVFYQEKTEEYGSFEELIVDWTAFESSSPQDRYTYDRAYGANNINDLQYPEAEVPLTVTSFSDSFRSALNPFFVMTYRNYIDCGSYKGLSADIIRDIRPDIALVLPWAGYFTEEGVFQYIPPGR